MSLYASYADAVKELIEEGEPIDLLEEYIDCAPFDEDERSALWLLAAVGSPGPTTPDEQLLIHA